MKKKLFVLSALMLIGLVPVAAWLAWLWFNSGDYEYTWDDEYAPDGYRSDFQSTHSAHP